MEYLNDCFFFFFYWVCMWVGVEGVEIVGGQEFCKQIVGDYREKNMLGKGYSYLRGLAIHRSLITYAEKAANPSILH